MIDAVRSIRGQRADSKHQREQYGNRKQERRVFIFHLRVSCQFVGDLILL
jgi:hypothetical protein